jgi:hypothetical protein
MLSRNAGRRPLITGALVCGPFEHWDQKFKGRNSTETALLGDTKWNILQLVTSYRLYFC